MKIDALVNIDSPIQVLLVESFVYAVRILVELFTSPIETPDYNLLTFQLFISVTSINTTVFSGIWNFTPVVAICLQIILNQMYELLYMFIIVVMFLDVSAIPKHLLVLFYTLLQLQYISERSNVLRTMSLICLYLSSFGTNLYYYSVFSVLAIEFSSWSTERYMLPWRIPESSNCCTYFIRFFISFVVGIYYIDASKEEEVYVRPPNRYFSTLRGISIYGDRAFVRYKSNPLGTLMAYVQGLVPIQIRWYFSRDEEKVRAYFLSICVFTFSVKNWSLIETAETMTVASRFPARRLVQGLLIRL